jgi:hypothetical protein
VLIARVHPEILRNEGLPDALLLETAVWQDRCGSLIDAFGVLALIGGVGWVAHRLRR